VFRIIEDFIVVPKHSRLIKYTGALSGISGLFLGITPPAVTDAIKALAYIQLFWLILLTFTLTYLFTSFVKFVLKQERDALSIYDVPVGAFTGFIGVILIVILLNLWRYMLSVYTEVFAAFTVMIGFPALIALGSIYIAIWVRKIEHKIPLIVRLIVDSIIFGALCSVAGLYIQVGITQYFYPYWFTKIFPIVAIGYFILILFVVIYKNRKIFKPYVPVQQPINSANNGSI
jgi:hypothetical protein